MVILIGMGRNFKHKFSFKNRFYSNIGTLKYIIKNIDDISVEIFYEFRVGKRILKNF